MPDSSDPNLRRVDPGGSDASIIAAAIEHPESFGLLFDRHHRAIHRYLARRVGTDDADDLLAEVFVSAFRARHRYDQARPSALPWLYGIAANLSARMFRSRTRGAAAAARLSGWDPDSTDPHERQIDRLVAEAEWPLVAAALDTIPDGPREALLLHVWEDLTYEEIAAATDVPIGTVRSRISRARATLRELLDTHRASTDGRVAQEGMGEAWMDEA